MQVKIRDETSILLRILEISGSNLGPDTILIKIFRRIPLFLEANAGIVH
jgi:hypothetical protein